MKYKPDVLLLSSVRFIQKHHTLARDTSCFGNTLGTTTSLAGLANKRHFSPRFEPSKSLSLTIHLH